MSFITVAIVGGSVALAGIGTKLGMSLSGRKDRKEEQEAARLEMLGLKEDYENLDTSNLAANVKNQFTNMENTYEDMTVNQQQAQFEAQQGAQQRANIMSNMSGAAGGSGIAALAQAMAQQGQLATQRASASIGLQESQIQKLRAGEASRLQTQEREGEVAARTQRLAGAETARGLEYSKTGTLLGMSQQRLGAANKARAEAKAQQMGVFGDLAGLGMQAASMGMKMGASGGGGGEYVENYDAATGQTSGGFGELTGSDRRLKKNINKIGRSPSGLNIYSFEYKESKYGKGKFQGVMSDEVPKKTVTNKDGYDMVDYSKLDVEFKQI